MNSREKGKRGERELARKLKEYGYDCRRGQDGKFKSQSNIFVTSEENIYCFNMNGELLFFTDYDIASMVVSHRWGKLADGYSGTMVNGKITAAHRIIINAPQGKLVDHINGNKKDNRVSNLRLCNKSENAYNSKVRTNNKSGRTGVYFRKDTGKWSAGIKHNNKKICLGCYDTFEEAVSARENGESTYAKEFVRNGDK